jgi:hypothetical protein
VQIAAFFPNVGLTFGPVDLTNGVLITGGEGYHCCTCSCGYCFSPTGDFCSGGGEPEGTPDPTDPCSGHPASGTDARLATANFACGVRGTAPAGGCNPPPGGNGIEPETGRTRCGFTIELTVQLYDCSGGYSWLGCAIGPPGGPPGSGAGTIYGVLDCTTATCRCPHGLYLKFGPPLSCFPPGGAPGGGVIDVDGYIEISAVDPGEPCPDNFPCPDGIYG